MLDEEGFEIDAGVSPTPKPEPVADTEVEVTEEVEVEENEADSSPADDENVEEKTEKDDSRFQKRIDELTASYRKEQREAEAARKEADDLRKQIQAIPKPSEPIKTLEDFEYDQDKHTEYVFAEAERRATEAAERVASGFQQKSVQETVVDKFNARVATFSESVEDYKQVVGADDLPISTEMAQEIRMSEIGPEMAYYLGKHPEKAAEIYKLSPRQVIRELTLLESTLLQAKSKAGKTVSNAPPPAAKIAATTPATKVSTTDPKSDNMSDDEWFRAEEKRKARLNKG